MLSVGLLVIANLQLVAGPGNALILYPGLLVGRGDVEKRVEETNGSGAGGTDGAEGFTVSTPIVSGEVPESGVDEFASADPWSSELPGVPKESIRLPRDLEEASSVDDPAFRDYNDTLIRSDIDSRVRTYIDQGGDRFPEDWTSPPGTVPGAHPGYRREVETLDYRSGDGVVEYPAPEVGSGYAYTPYSYPSAGYSPDGPFAYRYDGMEPFGEAGYNDGPGYYGDAGYEFDAGIPLLTNDFNPESAHFKAGPLYFQAFWVGAGVLYSDYHGDRRFRPGEEDGWLGYANFRFGIVAQLAPSLFLAVNGELIYIFGENELGFRTGISGRPFAELTYEGQSGPWDYRLYAQFGTGSFSDLFGSNAYDRAGRYSFGFLGYDDRRSDLIYDPFLYSRLGAQATTLTSPEWRLTLTAEHTDYWYLGDDRRGDDHHARERLGVRYSAEPDSVPFTPWVSYDLFSHDYFETLYHTFYVGGSGRLTENVHFDGRFGYLWQSDDRFGRDRWLWNIGLKHQINQRTYHGVRVGQDFFQSDYTVDTAVSSFVRYYITHEFTDRLRLHAFAQWSTDEYFSGPLVGGEYDRELYGVILDYKICDRISTSYGYRVEYRDSTRGGRSDEWEIFDATLNTRIGLRTTAYLRYQHEDTDDFYEDLYMAGIRRHF